MASIQELTNRAIGLVNARKFEEVLPLLREILQSKPDNAPAREMLVTAALVTGRIDEGLSIVRAAANARRSLPELQEAVASLEIKAGLFDAAEKSVRRAMAIRPGAVSSQVLLGVVMGSQGRFREAEQALVRACEIDPKSTKAWYNLGENLLLTRRYAEGVEAFRKAVATAPGDPVVRAALVKALYAADRTAEALKAARHAVSLAPNHPSSLNALGNVLMALGHCEEACEVIERALELDPRFRAARTVRLLGLNYISDDGAALRAEHRRFGEMIESEVPVLDPAPPPPAPARRLRIGFVSADFREHACAHFLAALFEGLSRSQFELWGFYNNAWHDAQTARFKALADGWGVLAETSTAQAAGLIREAGIDILIDCSGHTDGNRLDVFAARPCGVQMTFLGYPNTTGLKRIDYRLVDAITDPSPTADGYAEEQLLRIPECLWCFRPAENAPPVGSAPAEKTGRVTIGSFNNLSKMTSTVVEVWAEILKRAPGSTLLLKNRRVQEAEVLARLRGRFEELGVEGSRIEAVAYAPSVTDHLLTYDRIDFQLDTFPYNGTTTTCESFWQGVPVVAVEGKVHAARVSQSLLHAVGLDELVAKDIEGYIEKAVALATDIPRLSRLRASMRGRMESSALRDEKGYCERFGRILLDAWNSRGARVSL